MDLAITFFFLALLFTTTQGARSSCPSAKSNTSDLPIYPIYGECSPFAAQEPKPWPNSILDMARKDPSRVAYLASLVAQKSSAPIASGQQVLNIGNYLVRVTIGTPAQLLFMVMDTSLDVAWVPCSGCLGCSSTVFDPYLSSTFGSMDCAATQCNQVRGLMCPPTGLGACQFNQSYGGDSSSFVATLSYDSFSLGNDVLPSYAFGCINNVYGSSIPPQGLLGLGRGALSLIIQSAALYQGVFSYCLPSFRSYYFSGSLKLGPTGQPPKIKTTPLLRNPQRPSLYYVNLMGVSVGQVRVPIPVEYLTFNPVTGTGTIIDSGTVITRFVQPVYELIRDEYRNQVQGPFSLLGVFDTCFPVTHEQVPPTVTLHFEGLDLVLPLENTLIHSNGGSLGCLAMAGSPNNADSVLNIFASFQQQNLRIVHDTLNSRLGITRELCN